MKDESTKFRRKIWKTTLGFRAKLTLLALWEIGDIKDGLLLLPPDAFRRISPMVGRSISDIVSAVQRLSEQKIILVLATSEGYSAEFHPENEIRFGGQQKKAARG
jgi:hypothetical protein